MPCGSHSKLKAHGRWSTVRVRVRIPVSPGGFLQIRAAHRPGMVAQQCLTILPKAQPFTLPHDIAFPTTTRLRLKHSCCNLKPIRQMLHNAQNRTQPRPASVPRLACALPSPQGACENSGCGSHMHDLTYSTRKRLETWHDAGQSWKGKRGLVQTGRSALIGCSKGLLTKIDHIRTRDLIILNPSKPPTKITGRATTCKMRLRQRIERKGPDNSAHITCTQQYPMQWLELSVDQPDITDNP